MDSVDFTAIPPAALVAGNVGAYAEPIAEHVMAMTLSLAKHLPAGQAALARGEFDRRHTVPHAARRGLRDPWVRRHRPGHCAADARVRGAGPYAVNSTGRASEPADWVGTLADLDQGLAAADVLVISIPLTAAPAG